MTEYEEQVALGLATALEHVRDRWNLQPLARRHTDKPARVEVELAPYVAAAIAQAARTGFLMGRKARRVNEPESTAETVAVAQARGDALAVFRHP